MIRNGFIKTVDDGWVNVAHIARFYIDDVEHIDHGTLFCVMCQVCAHGSNIHARVTEYTQTRDTLERFLYDMLILPFVT